MEVSVLQQIAQIITPNDETKNIVYHYLCDNLDKLDFLKDLLSNKQPTKRPRLTALHKASIEQRLQAVLLLSPLSLKELINNARILGNEITYAKKYIREQARDCAIRKYGSRKSAKYSKFS
jgi:hypothetical protein